MTQQYNHWVVPLMSREGDERSFAGTAFVTREYIITAGHVLQPGAQNIYAKVGDTYLSLPRDKWIPRQVIADDRTGWDVALFRINAPQSPFSLAVKEADTVEKYDELEILCWQMKADGQLEQVYTPCLVISDDENYDGYISVSTALPVTHGASGCPVFKDGKVYGLLAMGRDKYELPKSSFNLSRREQQLLQRFGKNTCWVFKSSRVARFIPDK